MLIYEVSIQNTAIRSRKYKRGLDAATNETKKKLGNAK
jgi:hypothetical protein